MEIASFQPGFFVLNRDQVFAVAGGICFCSLPKSIDKKNILFPKDVTL